MLRYLRPAGGGLAAVSLATVGAYFVAAVTGGHPQPWWPYVLLLGLTGIGALGYLMGHSDSQTRNSKPPRKPLNKRDREPVRQPPVSECAAPPAESSPTVADRWHHTSDGVKVPALMGMTHTVMSHPGYRGRQTQDEPPSVKIGMLVACRPIDPSVSGTELRAKFAAFLGSPAVHRFVGALTHIEPTMSWKNMAGHGTRALEAALTADEDLLRGVPIASALLLPPTTDEALYGRNGQTATFILYLEPRTTDGHIPAASDLANWHERFNLALALPAAFAEFLVRDLGLATSDDPPAQLGIWLKSHHPLTVMIDVEGLRMLPGSTPSNQFTGWTFAGPSGRPAAGVARELIVQLCEHTLHLDAFEQALTDFDAAPIIAIQQSDRSIYIEGDSYAPNITGDGNTIQTR